MPNKAILQTTIILLHQTSNSEVGIEMTSLYLQTNTQRVESLLFVTRGLGSGRGRVLANKDYDKTPPLTI